jgi:dienelactone hydrolase
MAPNKLLPVGYVCEDTWLTGYYCRSDSDDSPLVILAHEAMGVTTLIKSRAERLTKLGYSAFALDLYGAEDLDLATAQALAGELMRTPHLLRKRAFAGLKAALELGESNTHRCAAIGYCQGGQTVLELARGGAPIQAAIGIHPGLKRAAGSCDGPIEAKVLLITGDQDPVVTPDERAAFADEMRSAGADWQLHILGGVGHSFTNPGIDAYGFAGFKYDPAAERRSWQMTLALLDEVLRS